MLPKNPTLFHTKNQIFDILLTVFLLLMLPFSEAAVCRCYTKSVLCKIHRKNLYGSLCFNKVAGFHI